MCRIDSARRSAERQQRRDFVARIDEHGLARVLAGDDEAVLEEGADGLRLDYHDRSMILAILDDLMFTSKIKTAANQLGVDLPLFALARRRARDDAQEPDDAGASST